MAVPCQQRLPGPSLKMGKFRCGSFDLSRVCLRHHQASLDVCPSVELQPSQQRRWEKSRDESKDQSASTRIRLPPFSCRRHAAKPSRFSCKQRETHLRSRISLNCHCVADDPCVAPSQVPTIPAPIGPACRIQALPSTHRRQERLRRRKWADQARCCRHSRL